jgi:V8-like Glu-specific endopeptidase
MNDPVDDVPTPRPPRRRLALAVAAVLSLSGIFGVSPQVVAAASPRAPAAGDGNVASAPSRSDHAVRDYWTPERMRGARDAGSLVSPAPPRSASSAEAEAPGAPESVPGATGSLGPAPAETGAENYAATTVPRPYTDLPDRLNGKVFFTKTTRPGGNFVCSGTLVNNSRKNLVITAGHCVHGGDGGQFHDNWLFVPAYDGTKTGTAQRPYGTWTARELFTRDAWIDNSDNTQDIGVALLANGSDGQPLGATIGGQGITFNVSASQNFSDFGYPAARPFDGTSQWRCNSTLRGRDTGIPGTGPDPLRIECDMTGGSSGGGWLINIGTNGIGFVNSVNSYGYPTFDPGFEYGPYFGNEAKSLYDFAKDRGPAPK